MIEYNAMYVLIFEETYAMEDVDFNGDGVVDEKISISVNHMYTESIVHDISIPKDYWVDHEDISRFLPSGTV